ncbi:MAG: hypothetical protein FJ278_14200, partial [Planctomycetes bacterium]|nr:hypothetical protein [Planctomycetota bacterium]
QDEQINLDKDSGVVKVLRVNQKNLINDYVTALIPLQNAIPRELREVMKVVTGKEGGRAEVVNDKKGDAYFLQVICPKFQLPYIEAAVKALDIKGIQEDKDGSETVYYAAKNRDIAAVDPLAKRWSSDETVSTLDPKNNAALHRGEPYRVEEYLKGAKLVDIPPSQVLLEAAIYEVNVQDDLKLGLDYIAWKNGPGRNLLHLILAGEWSKRGGTNLPNTAATASGSSRIGQVYAAGNFLLTAAYLDFLASKGKARTLSTSRVLAKSGSTAELSSVDQVLSFSVTPSDLLASGRTSVTSRPASTTRVPDARDPDNVLVTKNTAVPNHKRYLNYVIAGNTTGVNVLITPHIGLESMELQISAVVSDVTGFTPQKTPIIESRTVSSLIRLQDGQPFVLAGLRRHEDIKSSAKMPFLGSIPVLGYLFGQATNSKRSTEVVILITPKVTVGAGSTLETPLDVKTRAQVLGDEPLPLPQNSHGFDMWLLDEG